MSVEERGLLVGRLEVADVVVLWIGVWQRWVRGEGERELRCGIDRGWCRPEFRVVVEEGRSSVRRQEVVGVVVPRDEIGRRRVKAVEVVR